MSGNIQQLYNILNKAPYNIVYILWRLLLLKNFFEEFVLNGNADEIQCRNERQDDRCKNIEELEFAECHVNADMKGGLQ